MATILVDFCIQNQEIISFSLLRKSLRKLKTLNLILFRSTQYLHRHFSTV